MIAAAISEDDRRGRSHGARVRMIASHSAISDPTTVTGATTPAAAGRFSGTHYTKVN